MATQDEFRPFIDKINKTKKSEFWHVFRHTFLFFSSLLQRTCKASLVSVIKDVKIYCVTKCTRLSQFKKKISKNAVLSKFRGNIRKTFINGNHLHEVKSFNCLFNKINSCKFYKFYILCDIVLGHP